MRGTAHTHPAPPSTPPPPAITPTPKAGGTLRPSVNFSEGKASRSLQACYKALAEGGHTKVKHLERGIFGWYQVGWVGGGGARGWPALSNTRLKPFHPPVPPTNQPTNRSPSPQPTGRPPHHGRLQARAGALPLGGRGAHPHVGPPAGQGVRGPGGGQGQGQVGGGGLERECNVSQSESKVLFFFCQIPLTVLMFASVMSKPIGVV